MRAHNFTASKALLLTVALILCPAIVSVAEQSVPGIGEVIVYKPQQDAKGRPAVKIRQVGKEYKVEFAPCIHVHRNYYAGDKNFQGPVVRGGRTIVVARHPLCNEPVYVDLSLPGGAPRIHHNKTNITYVFRDRRVIINFHKRNPKLTKARVVSGRGFFRRVKEIHAKVAHGTKKGLQQSQTLAALHELSKKGSSSAAGVFGFVDQSVAQLVSGIGQVTSFLPGGIQAEGMSKELPYVRQQALDKAATKTKKRQGLFGLFK